MSRLARSVSAFLFPAAIAAGSPPPAAPPPSSPPPATSSSPSSSSASGAAAPRRPRAHFFVGEVVEIVAAENRFSVRETLRDGSPKVTFFTADPDTTVFRGKEPAAFGDLRVNDHVTIKYTETAGTRKTVSIRITPSAKPKAAPPPAKSPAAGALPPKAARP
jgi:hypothetical protein